MCMVLNLIRMYDRDKACLIVFVLGYIHMCVSVCGVAYVFGVM